MDLGAHRLAKSIRNKCVVCRRIDLNRHKQIMSPLPVQRLKPSPPFKEIALDLFGPFLPKAPGRTTRGNPSRSTGRALGLIIVDFGFGGVHIEALNGEDSEAFMKAMRRFISIRGPPRRCHSDQGSQIVAAADEFKDIVTAWNNSDLETFAAEKGFVWTYSTPDAPWQNGLSESLIKSVKRLLKVVIGPEVKLPFEELLTAFYEIADMVNDRPIGRHPTSPSDGAYLSPNDLILARSGGRLMDSHRASPSKNRYNFIQKVVDDFWKRWLKECYYSLLPRKKWHYTQRNMKKGDIVIITDESKGRNDWTLAEVVQPLPSADGRVRNVKLRYKAKPTNPGLSTYSSTSNVFVQRPVQRLVLIYAADESEDIEDFENHESEL